MHSLLHLEAGRARAAGHARIPTIASLPPGAAERADRTGVERARRPGAACAGQAMTTANPTGRVG